MPRHIEGPHTERFEEFYKDAELLRADRWEELIAILYNMTGAIRELNRRVKKLEAVHCTEEDA